MTNKDREVLPWLFAAVVAMHVVPVVLSFALGCGMMVFYALVYLGIFAASALGG